MDKKLSLCEAAALRLWQLFGLYRLPFLSSLGFGLLAHMYAFSNKLLNADEISALFSKGATVTSGRWGLEVTSLIFPNVSMPWIYGLISLVLLACAVCMTVSIFNIRSKLLQLLLAAVILSFPAVLGNFCFMFTSAPYALAIFLAVLSVRLFTLGGWKNCLPGVLVLAFSLGIYQAYISLAASFMVLCLIGGILEGEESALQLLKKGVRYVLLLLAGLALYYSVTLIVDTVGGHGYQDYEFMSGGGIIASFIRAYTSFVRTVLSGYFGYVNSGLSLVMHLVLFALCLVFLAAAMKGRKDAGSIVLLVVLLAVFPLSVNCMYLIASVDIIHTLVLFSFISVYVMVIMLADRAAGKGLVLRDAAALALALIAAGNIFYCNKVYLKMALEYENAYAFYNTLMAQVMETPGFSEYTIIDFVGSEAKGLKEFDEIDTSMLTGPNDDLVNIYTRVDFMRYYMGLDLYSYREDTVYADWYKDMPSYPDEGSIMMRPEENRIIIKLQ